MQQWSMRVVVCLTVLLACVAVGNLFYKIGEMDVVDFDEARHGISAMEMLESENFVVNTFLGEPDYWNLKPPLAFATMATGFSLFGYNTFGLRFFSALITLMTLVLVMYTCKKKGNYVISLIAGAIILSSRTFIAHHNARSGDADALFIFFNTAAICVLLCTDEWRYRYALACFLASLAFLTKSFHAGPLCATIALFFFMDNKISVKNVYGGFLSFLCFLLPILLWAVLRFHYDGMSFLGQMVSYDAVERLTTPLGSDLKSFDFLVDFMVSDFKIWLICLGIACLAAFFPSRLAGEKPGINVRFLGKLCLAIAIPLTIFTLSTHKLRWYAFPAYPLAAMLMACLFDYFLRKKWHASLAAGFICLVILTAFALSEVRTAKAIAARIERFNDPVQDSMKEIADRHTTPVTLFRSQGKWDQSDILASKFAGNVILEKGNLEAHGRFKGVKALIVAASEH